MSIEYLVNQFIANGEVAPTLAERLVRPEDRLAIYKLIVDKEARKFRPLLLKLFDEEISFRHALWDGSATDDGTFSEGIFHCAFLIHRCGEPSDAALLWRAQHLNQDIGELDGEYFVGAGIAETLAHLRQLADRTSLAIAKYVEIWSHRAAPDSISKWRHGRRQWILET